MRAETKKRIARYWGYILVVALYFAWFHLHVSPLLLITMSLLIVLYCLFQAPAPCCARNRNETFCRNNGRGLLGGCWIESHKWRNATLVKNSNSWPELTQGVLRGFSGYCGTISAAAGVVSAVAAIIPLILGK